MEISKEDIKRTIEDMIIAGKIMPQRDRIRCSRDPETEQAKVLAQTVALWWDLFGKRHIGVERWRQASSKALVLNSIPRLDTNLISPALMEITLEQCEKEYLQEQAVKHETIKNDKAPMQVVRCTNIGKLWTYHAKHHLKPFIELPSIDDVRAWLPREKYPDEYIEKNQMALKIYLLFSKHAKRDNQKLPVKMVLDTEGYLSIEIVN